MELYLYNCLGFTALRRSLPLASLDEIAADRLAAPWPTRRCAQIPDMSARYLGCHFVQLSHCPTVPLSNCQLQTLIW